MKMKMLVPRIKRYVSDAPTAWRALNGVVTIYKPAGVTYLNTRDSIIHRLCKG